MFKYVMISIVLVPILLGVRAVKGRDGVRASTLWVSWAVYAVLWFGALYYLRYRWG